MRLPLNQALLKLQFISFFSSDPQAQLIIWQFYTSGPTSMMEEVFAISKQDISKSVSLFAISVVCCVSACISLSDICLRIPCTPVWRMDVLKIDKNTHLFPYECHFQDTSMQTTTF